MKKMVDLIVLERELVQRLDVLNADKVFLQTDTGQFKIDKLIERLQTLRLIKKHFDLIHSGILRLIQNHKRIMEITSTHIF